MMAGKKAGSTRELLDWDLWGPLFLTLLLAITLSLNSTEEQTATDFALVISIVWIGSIVVTVNASV